MKKITILTALIFLAFISTVFCAPILSACKTFDHSPDQYADKYPMGNDNFFSHAKDRIAKGQANPELSIEFDNFGNVKKINSIIITPNLRVYDFSMKDNSEVTLDNDECLKLQTNKFDFAGIKMVHDNQPVFEVYDLFSENYPIFLKQLEKNPNYEPLPTTSRYYYVQRTFSEAGKQYNFFVFFEFDQEIGFNNVSYKFTRAKVVFPSYDDFKAYEKISLFEKKPYLEYSMHPELKYRILLEKDSELSQQYSAVKKISLDSMGMEAIGSTVIGCVLRNVAIDVPNISHTGQSNFAELFELKAENDIAKKIILSLAGNSNVSEGGFHGKISVDNQKPSYDFFLPKFEQNNLTASVDLSNISFDVTASSVLPTAPGYVLTISNLKINPDRLILENDRLLSILEKTTQSPGPGSAAIATVPPESIVIFSRMFTNYDVFGHVSSQEIKLPSSNKKINFHYLNPSNNENKPVYKLEKKLTNISAELSSDDFILKKLTEHNQYADLSPDSPSTRDSLPGLKEKINLIKQELKADNFKVISYNWGEFLILYSLRASDIKCYFIAKTDFKELNEVTSVTKDIRLKQLINKDDFVEYFYPNWSAKYGYDQVFPEFDNLSKDYPCDSMFGSIACNGFDPVKVNVFVSKKSIDDFKSGDTFSIIFNDNGEKVAGVGKVVLDDMQQGHIVFNLPGKAPAEVKFRTEGVLSALLGTGTAYISSPQLKFKLDGKTYQLFVIADVDGFLPKGWADLDLDIDRIYLIEYIDKKVPEKITESFDLTGSKGDMTFAGVQAKPADLLSNLRTKYDSETGSTLNLNDSFVYGLNEKYRGFGEDQKYYGLKVKGVSDTKLFGKIYASKFVHGDFDEMEITMELSFPLSSSKKKSRVFRENVAGLDYQFFEFEDIGKRMYVVLSGEIGVVDSAWKLGESNVFSMHDGAIVFPTKVDRDYFMEKIGFKLHEIEKSDESSALSQHSRDFCNALENDFPKYALSGFLEAPKYKEFGWEELEKKVALYREMFADTETEEFPEVLLMAIANIETDGDIFKNIGFVKDKKGVQFERRYVGLMQLDKSSFSSIDYWDVLQDTAHKDYGTKLNEFAKFQIEEGRKHLKGKADKITNYSSLNPAAKYYFVLVAYNGGEDVANDLIAKLFTGSSKSISEIKWTDVERSAINDALCQKVNGRYKYDYVRWAFGEYGDADFKKYIETGGELSAGLNAGKNTPGKMNEIYEYPYKVMRSAATACRLYSKGFNPAKGITASEKPEIKEADIKPEEDSDDPVTESKADNVFEALGNLNQKLLDDLFVIVE